MKEKLLIILGVILIGIPLIWIYLILFILNDKEYAHQFTNYILNFEYKET